MSPIVTTELLDTAKMPTCTYTIHSNSADGPPVVYVYFSFIIKSKIIEL